MRNSILILGFCILAGCARRDVEDSEWTISIATDKKAGQIEYLDLNGIPMEWSTARKGEGWLYFSRPWTNDRAWSFPGLVPAGEHNTCVKVRDGDIVTAIHESGRKFEIRIMIQTDYYVKVKYREI